MLPPQQRSRILFSAPSTTSYLLITYASIVTKYNNKTMHRLWSASQAPGGHYKCMTELTLMCLLSVPGLPRWCQRWHYLPRSTWQYQNIAVERIPWFLFFFTDILPCAVTQCYSICYLDQQQNFVKCAKKRKHVALSLFNKLKVVKQHNSVSIYTFIFIWDVNHCQKYW